MRGRVQRTDESCAATVADTDLDSSYSYDPQGRVQSVANANVSRSYSYDSYSRLNRETVTIDGLTRSSSYSYDSYHRPTAVTYHGGEVVTTEYGSPGVAVGLSSSVHGELVDNVSYDEAGRMTALRLPAAGGLWRTQSYYPWTVRRNGGMLESLKVGLSEGGGERLSRSYAYNSFGDITALTEETTSYTFGYDGLGRLTSAYGRTYSYDGANRLTTFNGQSYGYGDAGPYHAVDRIGDFDRFDYDASGNMVTRNKGLDSQQTLLWNAENRLSEVQDNDGDVVERYWYDVGGSRVKKVSGTTTTYTFFGHYEEEVVDGTTTAISHFSFGGLRIAVKRGSTLYHLHGDHLGSTSLTTAGSAVEASRTYYAYGAERSATGDLQTDRTFTGQKSDATGLLYYNARYYDPALGTFISPDSLVPNPVRVIDYNRFLYARGNPLKYEDPSGHIPFLVILVVAGVVGGLSNAVGNAAVQVKGNWDSERSWQENITDFNKKETAIAFGYGFVSGSLAPVLGPGPALVVNAALGAGQEITTDMVVHDKSLVESVDWETAESAILSAAGGYIQARIPRRITTTSRPLPGGRRPLELSIDPVDKWYGDPDLIEGNIRSLGGKQLQAITGARSLLGATSGNAPLSEAMSTLGVEPYVQGAMDLVEEKAEKVMRKVQDIIWGGGGGRLHDREPLHFMI